MAFDTETFYSNEYSIRDLGNYGYTHDERFECYLVSVASSDFEWVGAPKDCPWDKIIGKTLLSANAGFDQAVLKRLIELGIAPAAAYPQTWHCTANMSVYFGMPRSLAGAVERVFDHKISKEIRDKDIKGKQWSEFGPELQKNVLAYALDDARWCLKLWQELGAKWPEQERTLSELTYRMGEHGIYADRDGLEKDIQTLSRVRFEAEQRVPWKDDSPILSPKALATECRKNGIEPPASLAMDSPECEAWEAKYGDKFPWAAAMRDYRRSNALLKKFETALARIKPDGRMAYSLLVFGGHTGRWSGAGGLNIQNLSRSPAYFDDNWSFTETETPRSAYLRDKFIAAPGKKFVIADYAQIEARVFPWLAGDRATMDLVRRGYGIYEAHARQCMGWTGGPLKKEDPALYQLAKARSLALNFGVGWNKFIVMAKMYVSAEVFAKVFGAEVSSEDANRFYEYLQKFDKKKTQLKLWPTLSEFDRRTWVNSWLIVTDFRAKNPKAVALWKKLDTDLKASAGGTYQLELPSGRVMNYFDVTRSGDQMTMRTTAGGRWSFTYGACLAENLTQATAREVLGHALVKLHEAGIKVVCHVHDEVVAEVDEDFDPQTLVKIMTTNPSWCKTLPLGAEVVESKTYLK